MPETTHILDGIILPAEPEGGTLIQLQPRSAQKLFTTPSLVQALIAQVRTLAMDGFTPDLSTVSGRKEIASRAYKVAQTKTAIDAAGKAVVDELKALPKLVDEGRKAIKDGLDTVRDDIRASLTAWESRVEVLKNRLAIMRNTPADLFNADSTAIQTSIETLEADPADEATWQEFAGEAAGLKALTLATLYQMLEDRKKWETDQAELKRLRDEEAERKRLEREEELRKEGEERARKLLEAQQTAAAPLPATPLPVQDFRPFDASVVKEPTDPACRAAAPAPATAASTLEADVEHRRALNRQALEDLLPLVGGDEDMAKGILLAIVKRKVRNVTINY